MTTHARTLLSIKKISYSLSYSSQNLKLSRKRKCVPLAIILLILINVSLEYELIFLGENWSWSLLGLKEFNWSQRGQRGVRALNLQLAIYTVTHNTQIVFLTNGDEFSCRWILKDHMQVLKVIEDLSSCVDVLDETPHEKILSPA